MRQVHDADLFAVTRAELRVWRQVSLGRTSQQIARMYYRSPRTVEAQIRSLTRKLGLSNRVELARLAAEISLVPRISTGPRDSERRSG